MGETATSTPQSRHRRRLLLWLGLTVVALPVAVESFRVFLGNNFHTLIPGRVYRSAQLSKSALERIVQSHGIRTVINMRGCSDPSPWYLDECRVTHERNVAQEDVSFSAGRFPLSHEVRRLVEILDRCEYPALLHCRQGADRTGLAAVVVKLLQSDVSLEEARRHMSLRYGHVALGRPANLDRYLDLYSSWLTRRELSHSPAVFRDWLRDDQFPGDNMCRMELVEAPATIPSGRPRGVAVRAHNLGTKPWKFRRALNAGVHVCFWIYDAEDRCVKSDRAGLFDETVEPGDSIDLTLALPSLAAGKYRLIVDMIDESHCYFFQVGSEPLERDLVVVQ